MALLDRFEKIAKGENQRTTDVFTNSDDGLLSHIPLTQIRPDPNQPRKDLGDLESLKKTISAYGVIEPIIISPYGVDSYLIISGERRYTAALSMGHETIPAIIRTVEEHQRLEMQIIENIERKELSPFEEAWSYKRLIKEFSLTQEDVGIRLGKSKASINQTLRILDLPDNLKEEIQTSEFYSKSLLLEIVKRPITEQNDMWQEAKLGNLTVKKAREQKTEKEGKKGKGRVKAYSKDIKTKNATITIRFKKASVAKADIRQALKEALASLT